MKDARIDALFGELRSRLQNPDALSFEDIKAILAEVHTEHPVRYAQEWLPYLEKTDIKHTFGDVDAFFECVELLPFASRHALELMNVDKEDLARLEGAAELLYLRRLSIQGSLTERSTRANIALLTHDNLRNLEELSLPHNELASDVIVAIATEPSLANLRVLDLWDNKADTNAISAIANSPHLHELIELELAWNELGPNAIEALTRRQGLPKLERLLMTENPITDAGIQAIARAESSQTLTELDLSYTQSSHVGFIALGKSTNLDNLKKLDVSSNHGITTDAVLALLEGSPGRALSYLDISSMSLGDDIAGAIANSPSSAHLEELILTFHRFTDRGITALANSPHFANLWNLNLGTAMSSSRITQAAIDQLVNAPHFEDVVFRLPSGFNNP